MWVGCCPWFNQKIFMIAAAAIVTVFSIASCACSSHAGKAGPVSDLAFKTIFNTFKTGVLDVRACLGTDWLYDYELFPTKESVGVFERLLLEKSNRMICCNSKECTPDASSALTTKMEDELEVSANVFLEKGGAIGPPSISMPMDEDGVGMRKKLLQGSLVIYAVYKTLLYGALTQTESAMLKAILMGEFKCEELLAEIEPFIDRLTQVKDEGGLFAALVLGWDTAAVTGAVTELVGRGPDIFTRMVRAYAEGDEENHVEIPLSLFKCINTECRYYLATTFAYPRPYHDKIDWRTFYIMSRFSQLPSERIKNMCLEERPEYFAYEASLVQEEKGFPQAERRNFNPDVVPKEVWINIILHLDLLSQIYTAPMVCKDWKSWHYSILDCSLTVQETFVKDLNAPDGLGAITSLQCYPWNYFLNSRLTVLKYLFRRKNFQVKANQVFYIKLAWGNVKFAADKAEGSLSLKSYFDLYLDCRKVVKYPLEFHYLPGISDEEYAALVRDLVKQRNIVPSLPTRLLEEDCEKLMQMFKDDGDLIISLLQNNTLSINRLVVQLFSAKSAITPGVAAALGEKSALYRLLFDGGSSIEEHLDVIFQNYFEDRDVHVLAHNVVNLCLSLGPKSDMEALKRLREGIVECCNRTGGQDHMVAWMALLGCNIMTLLCMHRSNYSEEELNTIERVLGQCGLWDESGKWDILSKFTYAFLNCPRFAVKFAD